MNSALADKPETINEDAYGEGWIFVVEAEEPDSSTPARTGRLRRTLEEDDTESPSAAASPTTTTGRSAAGRVSGFAKPVRPVHHASQNDHDRRSKTFSWWPRRLPRDADRAAAAGDETLLGNVVRSADAAPNRSRSEFAASPIVSSKGGNFAQIGAFGLVRRQKSTAARPRRDIFFLPHRRHIGAPRMRIGARV